MDRKRLADIVQGLPHYSGDPLVVEVADPSVTVDIDQDESYIWPDVTQVVADLNASIILVTAPGAGGKSAAARAIARKVNTPLVDLSKLQVGSNTLTGLIPTVLGWERAGRFIAEIKRGSRTLVLDGLDEARLLAGRDNFVAFVNNLSAIADREASFGQLVILGRKDAIEDAYLLFLEAEIAVEMLAVQPLSFDQGSDLIDKTLDLRRIDDVPYRVHRTHVGPWTDFRNTVFREIALILGADGVLPAEYWPQVEDFLGYPPVLLALSERLAVDNPSSSDRVVRTKSEDGATENSRGALLRQIVESIMDRESAKARDQCAKLLGVGSSELSILYGREEQVLRILRVLSSNSFGVIAPASLTDERKKIYEDHIESFVLEHPFLLGKEISNVVFADYVRAFVSTVQSIGAARVSGRDLLSLCMSPGPFYAHFMYDLSRQASPKESDFGTLHDEVLVGDIIRSHIAGAIGETVVTYAHRKGPPAYLSLSQYIEDSGIQQAGSYVTKFEIENPVGILELPSPLSRCIVSTIGDVILTTTNGSVQLGPLVAIVANEVSIEGEHFIATGSQDAAESVFIIARRRVEHSPQIKVTSYPEGTLTVLWPDMWFQWKKFEVKTPEVNVFIEPTLGYQILFWIRRILSSMKGSSVYAPSVYYELLDKLIIGVDPVGRLTLEALVELNLIEREAKAYVLNVEELAKYEVNYAALRGPDVQAALQKLFQAVSRTDLVISALTSRGGEDAETDE